MLGHSLGMKWVSNELTPDFEPCGAEVPRLGVLLLTVPGMLYRIGNKAIPISKLDKEQ